MCGSQGNNCCCCPDAMIFQEEICGNFGPLANGVSVWLPADVNDYFQATYEVFNAGPVAIFFATEAGQTPGFEVPVGTSRVVSVNNPTVLGIFNTNNSATGKWCITLYKRVFG